MATDRITFFRTCALVFILSVKAFAAVADSFEGRVVKVSDGDTITVLTQGERRKVRLGGIDAPEKDQPFGRKSREYLASMVAGKDVVIQFDKTDRYGRIIGKILVDNRDANLEQVKAGMAHWYEFYKADQSKTDQRAYRDAEHQARSAGIGLWSDPHPIDPYDWRKGKRNTSGNTSTPTPEGCDGKTYCSEMASCAEATFYLEHCGMTRLDGDGDGTPCEKLCR